MGISATITSIVQPIEQDASGLAVQVGDVASQVQSYTQKTQAVLATPVSVNLPTTHSAASVTVTSPSWSTVVILGLGLLIVARLVCK